MTMSVCFCLLSDGSSVREESLCDQHDILEEVHLVDWDH